MIMKGYIGTKQSDVLPFSMEARTDSTEPTYSAANIYSLKRVLQEVHPTLLHSHWKHPHHFLPLII